MVIFIVPKNSGLKKYSETALSRLDTTGKRVVSIRGEDVPLFVDKQSSKGVDAIGLTGEDLFVEYKLRNPSCDLQLLERIVWQDDKAMFGKPTLCLIGPQGYRLPSDFSVCISSKYQFIAARYLENLESSGYITRRFYVSGCVESVCSEKISDTMIDIVYSGASVRKENLEIYDRIFSSDFVIIGKK